MTKRELRITREIGDMGTVREFDFQNGVEQGTLPTAGAPTFETTATHTVSNASYTVLDDDGYNLIVFEGVTSAVTGYLPTLADNPSRLIGMGLTASTGSLLVSSEDSGAINGSDDSYLLTENDNYVWFQANEGSTKWNIVGKKISPISQYAATGIAASGHGSSSTTVRRFGTSAVIDTGNDITVTDSATLGTVITVARDGIYSFSVTDDLSSGSAWFGFTKNASGSDLTAQVQDITTAGVVLNRVQTAYNGSAGTTTNCVWTGKVLTTDSIRVQDQGTNDETTNLRLNIVQLSVD